MNLDGYELYEQLKNGEPVVVAHRNTEYRWQFVGEPVGSDNYLLVTDGNKSNRYGWGWGSEQVWQAIAHLKRGWDKKQAPPYRTYNEKTEVEGGVAY
jgi:hypothetical protein